MSYTSITEEKPNSLGFAGFSTLLPLWSHTGHRLVDLEIVPFCRPFQALSNEMFFHVFGRFLEDLLFAIVGGVILHIYTSPQVRHVYIWPMQCL